MFISSTLPYINAPDSLSSDKVSPGHIGHCYEFVITDTIARYFRKKLGSSNVFFNTGVDEHGQKVYECAVGLNMNPQEYCDRMSEKWIDFCEKFRISYNNFYRTSDSEHKEKARKFFYLLEQSGNIYYSQYTDLYCKGCESFKSEKDLVNGHCEQHPSTILEKITEENYFFRLSKNVNSIPFDILVDSALQSELDYLIKNVEDMSVSREKEKVSWAIELPGTNQTIYCWKEALSNYFFAAGYNPDQPPTAEFLSLWENSLIVCGKDNLRFQAMILPALLNAGSLPSNSKVLVHGMILDEKGNKMSKSEGNVIDPITQLEKHGLNPLRYYLVAGLNTFGDSKFSEKKLIELYNSNIANGFGNLLTRTLHLINIKEVGIETLDCTNKQEWIDEQLKEIDKDFENYNLRDAYFKVAQLVTWGNVYIDEQKPFSASCTNREGVLNDLYYMLSKVAEYYIYAMPDIEDDLRKAFREKKKVILFQRLEYNEPQSA